MIIQSRPSVSKATRQAGQQTPPTCHKQPRVTRTVTHRRQGVNVYAPRSSAPACARHLVPPLVRAPEHPSSSQVGELSAIDMPPASANRADSVELAGPCSTCRIRIRIAPPLHPRDFRLRARGPSGLARRVISVTGHDRGRVVDVASLPGRAARPLVVGDHAFPRPGRRDYPADHQATAPGAPDPHPHRPVPGLHFPLAPGR